MPQTHLSSTRRHRIVILAAIAAPTLLSPTLRAQTRAVGLDISDYQGGSANFASMKSAGNSFIFLRASRGGTTGTWNQSSLTGTGNFRYDDVYWINNVNAAKAAGLYAGGYHYDRADSLSTADTNATIIARAQQEADHLLQVAGPWIKPGYLLPTLDLEAGDNLNATQLSLFATTFADRVYAAKHVYPICYAGSYYANSTINSTVAAKMPNLWIARPVTGSNHATGDPIPASGYPNVYGKWNPSYPTIPSPQPWKFWQDGTVTTGGVTGDYDVAHGTTEFLKDFLVPVLWTAAASGDWANTANWNTGTDPNDAVTAAEDPENQYKINGVLDHDDVTRAGKAPAARTPGNVTASLTLTGIDDTVILDNSASAAAYAVTLSTGSYNIRKLYVKRPLSLTGGSLTINYDPTTTAAVGSATAPGSTTFSAQFSNPVTMSAGSLSVHTLLVDAAQTFTLAGGSLTLNTLSLTAGPTPAKLLLTGDVSINPLNSASALITTTSATNSGLVDLGGATRQITVADGAAAVDLTLNVPLVSGSLTKAGAGTLQLNKSATLNAPTTVAAGTLIATLNNQLGTAANVSAAGTLSLAGNLAYNLPLTLNGAGAAGASGSTAPGKPGNLHVPTGSVTWSGPISLAGAGTNSTDATLNTLSAASGATLSLTGVLSGSALAKSDNGTVVVAGPSPNTYTGLTRLYGGQLILEKDAALGTADSHTYELAASSTTIAFRSSTSLNYATPEVLHTDGTGNAGLAQVDNLAGNNTFAGSIAFGGPTLSSAITGSLGASAGSLTISGGLYARTGYATNARTLNKTGTGALLLTGDSSLTPASSLAAPLTNSTLNITAGSVQLLAPSPTTSNVPGLSTYTISPAAALLHSAGTLTDVSITNSGTFTQQNARLQNAALTLNAGSTTTFLPATTPSLLSSLTLADTATLDLTSNSLAIDYTGPTVADSIRQSLLSARNNGTWTGPGLTSSTAANDPQLRTALAYAQASDLSPEAAGLLAGGPTDPTTLVLKYTWYGDANLDGKLDPDDYALLDRGYAQHLTGWTNGDFNYDNAIDANDYALLDRVFAQSNGNTLAPSFLAQRESQFGDQYVTTLLASIPEPTSLLAACGLALLPPRRRRR